jgi:hypothetical protein
MTVRPTLVLALAAGLCALLAPASAGAQDISPGPLLAGPHELPDAHGAGEESLWDVFEAGRRSLEFTVGPYFSTPGMGARRGIVPGFSPNPTLDFLPVNVRLGTMLTTPDCDRPFLKGNFEILGEMLTAPAIKGYAHIAVGPDVMLRYNFMPWKSRVVPYFQVAAGYVYCDGYRDRTQDTLGSEGEFSLQAQVGCRYLVNERWSIQVEGGYLHLSNADLAGRNGGYNSFGGSVGITFHFPTGH